MNETPTPRTAEAVRLCKVISSAFGPMVGADDMEKLERELNNSIKIQDGMAMTILSLQAERDQLRKVCDEFAIPCFTPTERTMIQRRSLRKTK
jgi:hypothetical protein